jgi:hypothetical protein
MARAGVPRQRKCRLQSPRRPPRGPLERTLRGPKQPHPSGQDREFGPFMRTDRPRGFICLGGFVVPTTCSNLDRSETEVGRNRVKSEVSAATAARFKPNWPCECRFGPVKAGLTTACFVVSTTCEACAPATASFGRKQAGRCTGASSPAAAVSGRDPHLPRCFHREQHAQPARSLVVLSIRPRRTYACRPPHQARRHETAPRLQQRPNHPEPLSYAHEAPPAMHPTGGASRSAIG